MAKNKRRSEWILDPLTGIRYKRGSVLGLVSNMEKQPLEYVSRNRKKRKYYSYEPSLLETFSKLSPLEQLIVLVIFLGVIFYVFFFESFLQWLNKNWIYLVVLLIGIIGTFGVYFIKKWQKQKKFEMEQLSKGLVKFVDRKGNIRWGTPQEVEKWKKEDEELKTKENLFYRVVEAIKKFEPSRKYKYEFGYHTELQGYLRAQFPDSQVELQTGSSRPDIVIGNIAIEVKGPTTHRELESIANKAIRYSQYYDKLIVVLFELNVNPRYLHEWEEGIRKNFPFVEIIVK